MNKEQKEILQSQLNNEKHTIEELKYIFGQAQDDIVNKIIDLSRRRDMENLQTIIYQKQYQEVLRKQIDNILDTLHTNEFSTIEEYLTACYSDGFIGTMYDIAGQGIPLIIPMDAKQIVEALQTDSKISTTLYKRLGEDVGELKKAIRTELSRGVANGSSWNQVAEQLAKNMKYTPFQKAINNSIRITRTEGHRIQVQSAYDAQKKAKEKGADVVKQWDATMDGRTRTNHRKLDGQIRELEEPFEVGGMKAMHPSGFGRPEEDINCRCALLQRARWALGEEELEILREKARKHGLLVGDSKEYGHAKAKDFADYKKKYMQAVEKESVLDSAQKIKDEEDILTTLKNKAIEGINNANSHKPIGLEQMQKKHKIDLDTIINNAPENVRELTGKYMDKILFVNEKVIGAAHTSKKGILFNVLADSTNERGQWTTVFHEIGHCIDRAAKGASYQNKTFKMLIKKDFDTLVKNYQKEYNVNVLKAYENIGKSLVDDKYHSISDICGGITNNVCVGAYKHNKEGYWEEPHKLEKETFAHFYEATIRNDKEKLNAIKDVFPNAYTEFEKIVKELL